MKKLIMNLFVVTAVALFVNDAMAVSVALDQATSTFHQGNFGNKDQLIDGNTSGGNGMGYFNARFSNTTTVVETVSDVTGPGLYTFTIDSNLGGAHALRSFRLAATDADRSTFANNLPTNGAETPAGDVLPSGGNFHVLDIVSATSSGGATLSVGTNGIINVSGSIPNTDTYTITARTPLDVTTGFRLETLTGTTGAVGFASNGNATLSEFSVDFAAGGNTARAASKQLNLVSAEATFDQGGPFTIGSAIDGIQHGNNGWGIFSQQGQAQSAVFTLDTPEDADRLVFELSHTSPFGGHKLQEFVLLGTTDANPTLASNWIELTPILASTSLDGTEASFLGNTISITGSGVNGDNFQIVTEGLLGVTGFRLDALLGANGLVGMNINGGNGNIVLSEFKVFSVMVPEPTTAALALLGTAGLLRRRRRTA